MRKIWNKGHRIRASDKHLVYHFSIGMLLVVFVAVLLLLNIKQLMRTDWEHFSLLENGLTLSPYNFITILIATGVCALVAFLYYRFCYDSFKKLLHRQKLARMILENKWYEADTVQDSGFFTDRQSRSREKIVWFLIVACQRPDAKYFSDGIRDNFNFRVGLGRISELGYGMLFGSDVKKQFFQKRIKGRGYCDVGTSVISEFYTPLVPKGHDFLQEIGRLEEKRTASNES